MILPFLKVRGADYLRLVYGIDYLEDKYFNSVSKVLDGEASLKTSLEKYWWQKELE